MNIKTAIWGLINKDRHGSRWLAMHSLAKHGYLGKCGWFESFYKSMPVGPQGEPIPWYTYSAIRFLSGRVNSGMSVFEYGSGNSTLWWNERVAQVTACEHDRGWYESMKPRLPLAVRYIHAESSAGGGYAEQSTLQAGRFDVVVIDGRNRVQCARFSPAALTARGVIIWDNSDRDVYQEGYEFLLSQGFKRLDFWGMGPIATFEWCTSIFYRDSNCLGL